MRLTLSVCAGDYDHWDWKSEKICPVFTFLENNETNPLSKSTWMRPLDPADNVDCEIKANAEAVKPINLGGCIHTKTRKPEEKGKSYPKTPKFLASFLQWMKAECQRIVMGNRSTTFYLNLLASKCMEATMLCPVAHTVYTAGQYLVMNISILCTITRSSIF